jgi:hypothetical protein
VLIAMAQELSPICDDIGKQAGAIVLDAMMTGFIWWQEKGHAKEAS